MMRSILGENRDAGYVYEDVEIAELAASRWPADSEEQAKLLRSIEVLDWEFHFCFEMMSPHDHIELETQWGKRHYHIWQQAEACWSSSPSASKFWW